MRHANYFAFHKIISHLLHLINDFHPLCNIRSQRFRLVFVPAFYAFRLLNTLFLGFGSFILSFLFFDILCVCLSLLFCAIRFAIVLIARLSIFGLFFLYFLSFFFRLFQYVFFFSLSILYHFVLYIPLSPSPDISAHSFLHPSDTHPLSEEREATTTRTKKQEREKKIT